MLTGIFFLEGGLRNLLEQIFDVGKRKSGSHAHNSIKVDPFYIEPGQTIFQNSLSPVFIQISDRNNAIEPSGTEQLTFLYLLYQFKVSNSSLFGIVKICRRAVLGASTSFARIKKRFSEGYLPPRDFIRCLVVTWQSMS